MKKIAWVTTARSEYGASRWVIKAIQDDPDLELELWVGGTHLDSNSYDEIINDGYKVNVVGFYGAHDTGYSCYSLAASIKACSAEMIKNKPDMMIINGDRIELMAYVLAATIHGIPIAHIGGGEITDGSIDNETRYAISRYAHLHLVSDDQAAANLIRSGEEPFRVRVVGQCGLENMVRTEKLSLEETSQRIGLDLSLPTALCIYYPSREVNISIQGQIDCIIDTLNDIDMQTVFIYPCAEIGEGIVRDTIDEHCRTHDNCRAFTNLDNQLFQSLMQHSLFMIGNSSCGVIEYPFTGHKTINIGSRQGGRHCYPSVVDTEYSVDDIICSINHVMGPSTGGIMLPENYYPSQKIIQVIKANIGKSELLHKKILL